MINNSEKKNKGEKISKEEKNNLIDIAIEAMLEKKAKDIVCLDLTKLEKSICDSFIIANADTPNQVKAIADNVEDNIFKHCHRKVWHRQGDDNSIWIILDYGDIAIHIFQTECREYYKLEDLWADAEIKRVEETSL